MDQSIKTHKKLLKRFDNLFEYKKWWIWYCISRIDNLPSEIKTKLTDIFKPDKPLTINAITIKKPISSLSYACLKYVYDDILKGKRWCVTIGKVALNMNDVDPYLFFDFNEGNKSGAEFIKEFEPSVDLLLKDIKKEINKREIYIEKDINKIKPNIDMINDVINVLKQCQKNQQGRFPNLLRDSLEKYIDVKEGISYETINDMLRGTLEILYGGTFGDNFDPKISAMPPC